MKWRGSPKSKLVRRLMLFLLLLSGGAIVNVAVAWGCTMWSEVAQAFDRREITVHELNWLNANDENGRFDAVAFERDGVIKRAQVVVHSGFGVTWDQFGLHSPGLIESQRRSRAANPDIHNSWATYRVIVFSAGWPLPSLSSEFWSHTLEWQRMHQRRAIVNEGGWRLPESDDEIPRFLSWRPIWPGFAINTIFYAAILWMMFAFPGALRRRRRLRRGQCPACAYPIGTSGICTECGHELKARECMGLPPSATPARESERNR